MQPDRALHTMQIQCVERHQVWINERAHPLPIMLNPHRLYEQPLPPTPLALNDQHLMPLLNEPTDLLIVGTGISFAPLDPILQHWCHQHAIGLEVMNNQAAARAFQMLCADQRSVALLLFDAGAL